MEIILLKDVETLGYADDLVTVKPGYARNFLIPQGIAMVANKGNRNIMLEKERIRNKKADLLLAQMQVIVDKLKSANLKVGAKVGTTDKIFGSVTTHHLSQAIMGLTDVEIDRRKISIVEGDIKTLGTYTAKLDLHKDHSIEIPFEVVAE